jgi:hypothetical protein
MATAERTCLSLTDEQLDIIRQAQLTETVKSLRYVADELERLEANFPLDFRAGDIPGYLSRVRDDFDVLEVLGYVSAGEKDR